MMNGKTRGDITTVILPADVDDAGALFREFDKHPATPPRPISDDEYERKYAQLVAAYGGANPRDMNARRAMALAQFMVDTGWYQDRLAVKLGKSRPWVVCQLRFGRFLYFLGDVTTVTPLNERGFRSFWDQTDRAPVAARSSPIRQPDSVSPSRTMCSSGPCCSARLAPKS
jgi:hypothetical protein